MAPKDVDILTPATCECAASQGKGGLGECDRVEARETGVDPGSAGGPSGITRVSLGGRQEGRRQRRRLDEGRTGQSE